MANSRHMSNLPFRFSLHFLLIISILAVSDLAAQSSDGRLAPPQENQLLLADLTGDLAGAEIINGTAQCAENEEENRIPAESPGGFALSVDSYRGEPGDNVDIPVRVHEADGINSFRFTFLFNFLDVELMDVEKSEATNGWEITATPREYGIVDITGTRGEDGSPVIGTRDLVILEMRCADGCPCESNIEFVSLGRGIADATPQGTTLTCAGQAVSRDAAETSGDAFEVVALPVYAGCGQKTLVPVETRNASGLESFEFVVSYDEECGRFRDVLSGLDTADWDIEVEEIDDGLVMVTGERGEDGSPISGNAELARLKFKCSRPAGIAVPFCCLFAGGAIKP